MRDSMVAGVLAGIAGGLFYQIFVWISYLMGIAKITPFQLSAYVLIKPGLGISSLPAQGLGMALHFALLGKKLTRHVYNGPGFFTPSPMAGRLFLLSNPQIFVVILLQRLLQFR